MHLCKTLLLTPNQRLSRIAREKHDQIMKTAGKLVWEPLEAYPFATWITSLWESSEPKGTPKYLLNAAQTEKIFASIIQQETADFLPLTSLVLKSWQQIHEWTCNLSHPDFGTREETRYFQRWAREYQRTLNKNHWIDNEGVWETLMKTLPQLSSLLPAEITFLGFTDFSPREKKFMTALENEGVKIYFEEYQISPLSILKTSFADDESELETITAWAKEKSLQGTVGCIFPELSSRRDKIYAAFQRQFKDAALLNISLAKPLSSYPLIQAALCGISLLNSEIDQKDLTIFLLSPYFEKSTGNLFTRALLDKKLKATLPPLVNKSHLPAYAYFQQRIEKPLFKSLREWRAVFENHLTTLGWPFDKVPNSEEYQLFQHWSQLLEALEKLEVVLDKMDFTRAFAELKNLAQKTLFQPEKSPHAKIEILGILEAAGLTFDYVWIAGMHEEAWPLKTPFNPFLPFSLSEQNNRFCEKITQQLLTAGKEIFISYPATRRDIPLYASPLIQNIAEVTVPAITPAPPKSVMLETLNNDPAPKLDMTHIKHHGSEIFKDQAACPFRAFVKHRLGAKKMESLAWEISPLQKGNLVHKILEKIYEKIPSQQMLQAFSKDDVKTIILETFRNFHFKENALFIDIEKKRLEKLILTWLQYEKTQRGPFVVIAREEKIETHFCGFPLKLRIDRIDQIGEDKYLIIDYKTGKNAVKIDPLEEPQLPLYCVISGLPIEEVAIAQIRPNEIKLKKNLAQKEAWEIILRQLATEYLLGNAVIKPRHGEETCRYCDLTSLCRIKTLQFPSPSAPLP